MDLTRRNALQIGGLAAIAASSRRASPTHKRAVYFGANNLAWTEFKAAVPAARVRRIYYHHGEIPQPWPAGAVGGRALVSIEPYPPDLLAGNLDSKILGMAVGAPPGSKATPWYEMGPANPRGYPAFMTAETTQACQRYMHRLLRPTNVRVGSIICGPAIQLEEWIAPGLDWYANDNRADWFIEGGVIRVAEFESRQASDLEVWRHKAGKMWPEVVIAETGYGPDFARFAPEWFAMLAWNMYEHGGGDICTFWGEPGRPRQGPATVPWPPKPEVTNTIRWLTKLYGGRGVHVW